MKNEYKVSIGVEGVEDEYRWRTSVEVSIDEEGIKVKEVWEDWIGDWSEVEWRSQVWSEVKWRVEESKKWSIEEVKREWRSQEVKSRVKNPRSEEAKKWRVEEAKKWRVEEVKSREPRSQEWRS